jgi:hypothetical protein
LPSLQYDPHKNATHVKQTVNIHPYFSLLISEKLATLHEIKTIYTLEDVLNLLEVIQVNRFNDRLLS